METNPRKHPRKTPPLKMPALNVLLNLEAERGTVQKVNPRAERAPGQAGMVRRICSAF